MALCFSQLWGILSFEIIVLFSYLWATITERKFNEGSFIWVYCAKLNKHGGPCVSGQCYLTSNDRHVKTVLLCVRNLLWHFSVAFAGMGDESPLLNGDLDAELWSSPLMHYTSPFEDYKDLFDQIPNDTNVFQFPSTAAKPTSGPTKLPLPQRSPTLPTSPLCLDTTPCKFDPNSGVDLYFTSFWL